MVNVVNKRDSTFHRGGRRGRSDCRKISVASKRANVTILQNAMQGSASLDTVASWLKYIYPYGPQKVIPASISLQ